MSRRTTRAPATSLLALATAACLVVVAGPPVSAADPVLVGAGDIAVCGATNVGDEATADLLEGIGGTVYTLGDTVYPDGTSAYFQACFVPSWGRHKDRIRPAAGNHDYHVPGAADYFSYFGDAAGPLGMGYYSYDLGSWHIVVLNSNCEAVSCAKGSAQEQWLREDLADHPVTCTLAMWHHPLFSSGKHGGDADVRPFWDALHAAGADIVLSGHDHDYERFALQDPSGNADAIHGIRQFVVGTGGAGLRPFASIEPNSVDRNATTHGLLKLTLTSGSYEWSFLPVAGASFSDSGSDQCVDPGSEPPPEPTTLVNRSFEQDADGDDRPDGWTNSPRFTRSTAVAPHDGTYLGRFQDTTNSGTTIGQDVAASPATAYSLSCWVNIPATSDPFTFKLQVRWLRSDGSVISSKTIRKFTSDTASQWAEGVKTATSPSGTATAQVRFVASSLNGTIYVDDCGMQP